MEEINANNIDIIYLNEYNNVNISIKHGTKANNKKNLYISCNSCQQNENLNSFEICNNNCNFDLNSGNSNLSSISLADQSSVIVKNNKKRKKFKLQIFEALNEKIISNSTIFISFSNLNSHDSGKLSFFI